MCVFFFNSCRFVSKTFETNRRNGERVREIPGYYDSVYYIAGLFTETSRNDDDARFT